MQLTLEEMELIERSFERLKRADVHFAEYFYDCLFQMAPLIKPMFKSDRKVLEMHFHALITTAVEQIHQFDRLRDTLFDLGAKHRDFNVEESQFSIVKSAFLLSIEYQLKAHSNRETITAWGKYFDQIAQIMIAGLNATQRNSA
ncbi:MAG: globin domain-containing protein [Pseudomonadales bacterium]